MNILDQLSISNDKDLRPEFNRQALGLIASIRAGKNVKACEDKLAQITKAVCEHMIKKRHVVIPSIIDDDEIVQVACVKMLMCSREERYRIDSPMDYISTMMSNLCASMLRSNRRTRSSGTFDPRDEDDTDWFQNISEDGRTTRHNQSKQAMLDALTEEYGAHLNTLISNNGLTTRQARLLVSELMHMETHHPSQHFKQLLTEYYLGDLLEPGFYQRMSKTMVIAEGTVKSRVNTAQQLLTDALNAHASPEYEELQRQLDRIREFRGSFRPRITQAQEMPLPQGDLPEKKRRPDAELPFGSTFISPTDMIRRMGHTASPPLVHTLNRLLMELVSTRRDEIVTRADGTREAISELLVPTRPEGGGRYTIYINIEAGPFLEKQMGLTRHNPKTNFIPLTAFDHHLGRPAKPDTLQGTFDFLFSLWRENPLLPIGEGKQHARDFIQFVPPYNNQSPGKFLGNHDLTTDEKKQLTGKAMYIDPALSDYARQHLACRPEEKHASWARIMGREGGILERLGVYRKPTLEKKTADHLAVIELLTELRAKKVIMIGDPPQQKPASDYMGRFLIGGSRSTLEQDGIWMVDPVLLGPGKPLTKEMVTERARHILEHPEHHPAFLEALGGRGAHE